MGLITQVPFGKPIEDVYSEVQEIPPFLDYGKFGIFCLCTHKNTITTDSSPGQFCNEIYIMCQLDHPNIIRLEEVYRSHTEIYLLMDLCLGGKLFNRPETGVQLGNNILHGMFSFKISEVWEHVSFDNFSVLFFVGLNIVE